MFSRKLLLRLAYNPFSECGDWETWQEKLRWPLQEGQVVRHVPNVFAFAEIGLYCWITLYKGGRSRLIRVSWLSPIARSSDPRGFFTMYSLLPLLMAASAAASPTARQVAGTSVVTLSNNTGTPGHLASGVLYGIPDTPDQIPGQFYTDMGFNYARAGGAQVAAPGRGV